MLLVLCALSSCSCWYAAKTCAGLKKKHRVKIHKHVIVQRGRWNFLLARHGRGIKPAATYASEFLCEPKVVSNTQAAGISPAIDQAAPKGLLDYTNPNVAVEMVKLGTHTTTLMCDAASSNNVVCRMKHRQHRANVIDRAPGHFLLTERCQAHAHNNGKKVLKPMKLHLGRMYSLSKVTRWNSVQTHRWQLAKHMLHRRFQRLVIPPPQTNATLWNVADAIFDFNAEHHLRNLPKKKAKGVGVANPACRRRPRSTPYDPSGPNKEDHGSHSAQLSLVCVSDEVLRKQCTVHSQGRRMR